MLGFEDSQKETMHALRLGHATEITYNRVHYNLLRHLATRRHSGPLWCHLQRGLRTDRCRRWVLASQEITRGLDALGRKQLHVCE